MTWPGETAFGELGQNTSTPPQKKFIIIVRQFHDGIYARVQDNGEGSVTFTVTNGVKQECLQALTLFSIVFSEMLFDTFNVSDNRIEIWYRTDGSVFNLGRFQEKTQVKTDIVNEFLFADDCALKATTKDNVKNSVDKF